MAGPEDITLFSSVDRTKEPDFFKRFLDEGNKLPGIIASKPIILGGLQLTGGEKVLDAGCGLGDDTFEIAQIVGSKGHVVGIDVSETMILEARHRASGRVRNQPSAGLPQVRVNTSNRGAGKHSCSARLPVGLICTR